MIHFYCFLIQLGKQPLKRLKIPSNLKKWLDQNLLSLNTDKNKFIIFVASSRNLPMCDTIKINLINCDDTNKCNCPNIKQKVDNST